MRKKSDVVLIGCGKMGGEHLSALWNHHRVGNLCVADVDVSKVHAAVAKIRSVGGADRPYEVAENYHTFLDRVDLGVVATPVSLHGAVVRDCFERRIDVLCEKPMSGTVEEGKAIIQATKESGRYLTIGFILRFNETYKKLKELLDEGCIGRLLNINTRYYKQVNDEKWEVLKGLIRETSPITDCGSHYADVQRWFTGSNAILEKTRAYGTRTERDCLDDKYNVGFMEFTMENGVVCRHWVAWEREGNIRALANEREREPGFRIELVGEEGKMVASYGVGGKDRPCCDIACAYSDRTVGYDTIYVYGKERGVKEIQVVGDYKALGREFDDLIEVVEGEKREEMFRRLGDSLKSLEMVSYADELIMRNGIALDIGD